MGGIVVKPNSYSHKNGGGCLDDLYRQFPIILIEDIGDLSLKTLKEYDNILESKIGGGCLKKLKNDFWIRKINLKKKKII